MTQIPPKFSGFQMLEKYESKVGSDLGHPSLALDFFVLNKIQNKSLADTSRPMTP